MIREAILDNTVDTLKTIQLTGGYSCDVGSVKRTAINEFKLAPRDYPAIGVLWKREDRETLGMPHDYIETKLTLTVRGIVQGVEDLEEKLSLFIDDVEKSLALDTTRGGYATGCEPQSVVVFLGEREDLLYFDYDFTVTYSYVWGNP